MKLLKRHDPNAFVVKYFNIRLCGHSLYRIELFTEYATALRFALNMTRKGKREVQVIFHRNVLHTSENLLKAASILHPFATNEEIVEQVHHASYTTIDRGLMASRSNNVLVWATL